MCVYVNVDVDVHVHVYADVDVDEDAYADAYVYVYVQLPRFTFLVTAASFLSSGILPHTDGPAYTPWAAIVSLKSAVVGRSVQGGTRAHRRRL